MNSPPHRGVGVSDSRLPVVVCERHEADSASLSPSKPPPTSATTALFAPATLPSPRGGRSPAACPSRLVVNLQRCDLAATATVALPGASGRRRHAGAPAAAAPASKRRRLKLMCNGMTIYRDIDDVAPAPPPPSRPRLGRCAAARRRASLPTFPVASPSDSVVAKRRHASGDDEMTPSRDPQPFPVPVVDAKGDVARTASMTSDADSHSESFLGSLIDATSSKSDVNTTTSTATTAVSDIDSGIGPLDYSTDRSSIQYRSSTGTVPSNGTVPSSVADSSQAPDEPLELTTEQVRQRQKNDCPPLANQFAVC